MIRSVFRMDETNVGDWYCPPFRYFDFGSEDTSDVYEPPIAKGDVLVLGGGGLISTNFAPFMEKLASAHTLTSALVAWGVGENMHSNKAGKTVAPWNDRLPAYLKNFDLVGIRDYGTEYPWVPCASCMLDLFDKSYEVSHPVVVFEHKRTPLPLAGFPRRSNIGTDIAEAIAFLASGEIIITNSYHGAYWATLLGRRVIAMPNVSKMYRMKHPQVICAADQWERYAGFAQSYPNELAECREANVAFFEQVKALLAKRLSIQAKEPCADTPLE